MPDRRPMFQLEDLTIEEGSLVDKGDNPEAHVMLFKRAEGKKEETVSDEKKKTFFEKLKAWVGKTEPRTTSEILAEDNFREEFFKARMAFMDSVHSILDGADRDQMGPLLQQSVQEFSSIARELTAQMTKAAPDAAKDLSSILDRMVAAVSIQGVNDPNEVSKRAEFAGALEDLERFEVPSDVGKAEETKMPEPTSHTKSFEELLKGIEDEDTRKAFAAAHTAELEKAKASKPKPPFMDDEDKEEEKDGKKKSAPSDLPESVQKAMEAMQKQNADLAAKVAKLEDEKAEASFVAKAREMAGDVAIDVNELGSILKTAHESDPATAEKLEGMVKGLIAQAAKGQALTDSIGSAGGGRGAPTGPEAELEKKAEEIRKADPTLSESAAYVKAMDLNPELAAAAIRS